MMFIKAIFWLILGVGVLFFTMGLMSQRGSAKGLVNGELAPLPNRPNGVSSESGTDDNQRVSPVDAPFNIVKLAIIETGGTIVTETDNYIAATYMTRVFKFVDDVEIRRSQDNLTHIRSASRVGYSDRGLNRRRVKSIREIAMQLASQP